MLADVKILLDIDLSDNSKDQKLVALYKTMQQQVKNFCNLETVPQELDSTVSEMTAALYNIQYSSNVNQIGGGTGKIKRESLGDYSVEYDTEASSNISKTQTILQDFTGQLKKFRKLRM